MTTAIRIENLSKSYLIRHDRSQGEYRTLRESLIDAAMWPFKRLAGKWGGTAENFWALKNFNLEIEQGEVVGIIGRNGAGKSTLLKILSRITAPTTGRVELHGRVGSLLEVGTGFHPELTGRENIYLNGSILGMTRREIRDKFDTIVDFSGVEKFLDTPVKRYSSGMYVRLAFAVAAHLEPEILLVDEVLAVGDYAFQRKCLGRMREVSRGGRTIFFVSHNMAAIESLCTRVILIDSGELAASGSVQEVKEVYCQKNREFVASGALFNSNITKPLRDDSIIRHAMLLDEREEPTDIVPLGGKFHFCLRLSSEKPISEPTIGLGINDALGHRQLTVHTPKSENELGDIVDRNEIHCVIDRFPLPPGDYTIKIVISACGEEIETIEHAISFGVINAEAFGEGRGFHRGVCIAPSTWKILPAWDSTPNEDLDSASCVSLSQ